MDCKRVPLLRLFARKRIRAGNRGNLIKNDFLGNTDENKNWRKNRHAMDRRAHYFR
jgi:hypothetical protein